MPNYFVYPYPINIFGPENVPANSSEAAGSISFTDRAAIGINNAIAPYFEIYEIYMLPSFFQ